MLDAERKINRETNEERKASLGTVRLSHLTVGYAGVPLISDIDVQVKRGEILTLIGPNGAGKSTILKTMIHQLSPIEGCVILGEEDISTMSSAQMATKVASVMTKRVHPELMTCYEVAAMGRYPYTGRLGHLTEEDRRIVEEALRLVSAEALADRDYLSCSDGEKQRIRLAAAIAQEPELLILDEPTTFLDIRYKMEFMTVIRSLARKRGVTVILSLHELELARQISDWILCVKGEHVGMLGTPQEVFAKGNIERIFGLPQGSYEAETGRLRFPWAEECANVESCESADHVVSTKQTKVIMVQGTMSGVGKSLVVAGLCRIFHQDGYRVAPFKSQNMALNSYITKEGLEMGRAQVMQAEAAGIEPMVCMNPILLKPTTDVGSQVIVGGEVLGNMPAKEYFAYKKQLIPEIQKAFATLSEHADIIVIEGAGSPAEINLKENDIVNMGMADLVDAPVLLVGDIDRGGVFAQLLGTLQLLEPEERDRVKGLIINKFRGDKTILDPGITMLEEKGNVPVAGVVPYMQLHLEDEDSLTERFDRQGRGMIDLAVIRFPRISNFSDFDVFEQVEEVSLRYVTSVSELGNPDMILLPGSKNTIADLLWMRENGLEAAILHRSETTPIFGICGGFQMLGEEIADPMHVETGETAVRGMGLLPLRTELQEEKIRKQEHAQIGEISGIFKGLSGKSVTGYEIHMGVTSRVDGVEDISRRKVFATQNTNTMPCVSGGEALPEGTDIGLITCRNNIYGSYLHGIFDAEGIAPEIIRALAERKGILLDTGEMLSYADWKEKEFDLLAESLRASLNMDAVYGMLREARI